jgi:type IV pilus assembly protein PilW
MINFSRTMDRYQRRSERGFTLIELMISVTIALFLIGGALAIVGRTRSTFAAQNQLAQLQDNERLAMTFMAEVIESGGYFPNPKLYQASSVLPVVAGKFAAAGQAIFGTHSTSATVGDRMYVRFGAGLNDNVYGCTGVQNTTVNPYDTYMNFFYVNNPTGLLTNANAQLMCTFTNGAGTATPVPLVNGVTKMVILYGVKKNPTDTQSCTDTYLDASQVNANPGDWLKVCSVNVTLTFANPIIPAPPITIQRIFAVMTTVGVNS